MSGVSAFLAPLLLDASLSGTPLPSWAGRWIALFESPQVADGSTLEVSDANYERQQITFTDGKNDTAIAFPSLTASKAFTHFGIYNGDGISGDDDLLFYGAFSSPLSVSPTQNLVLLQGELTVNLS